VKAHLRLSVKERVLWSFGAIMV